MVLFFVHHFKIRCFCTYFQLDLATSGRGGIGNYIGICFIVGCFGVANAHVQGGMVGDIAFMCPEFMQVRSSNIFNFVCYMKL